MNKLKKGSTSRLRDNLSSAYVAAANRLSGRTARRKVVAYVESYDDVLFWSTLLRSLEDEQTYFEVMLPSQQSLSKGKKIALANRLGERLGECMIACVDADYDFLMQGATPTSAFVCQSPYVFHTYAYSIENLQCYAPALHNVCVMATLNDKRLFDFERFLTDYSRILFPLFAWNVWAYRYNRYHSFSLLDFFRVAGYGELDFYHPEYTLEGLRRRVNSKIARLQKQFPEGKKTYKPLVEELRQLGVTPETTYLYMRGHDLFDSVVCPMLEKVCERLRRDREREIRELAEHRTQFTNELSGYQHATAPVCEMLRKHNGFIASEPYRRIADDIRRRILRTPYTDEAS